MSSMIQEFQQLLKNQSIDICGGHLSKTFQKFNFYFITPQQNDFSNIIIIEGIFNIIVDEWVSSEVNHHYNSDYYIICFNYKIIIIDKSKIGEYYQFMLKNHASNFYFTSKKLEENISMYFLQLRNSDFKLKSKQINDCSNLIKKSADEMIKRFDLKVKKPINNKLNEIRAFWSILSRDISYFLILTSLEKSKIDRFLYYSDFFNEESNKKDIKIVENEFLNLVMISNGSAAITSLVYHIPSEKVYIKKEFFDSDSTKNFQKIEKDNYSSIHHPLFPRYYCSMKSFNHPCLLLEYIDGRTLDIIDKNELSINDKIKIVFQIIIIFEYLHFKEYIYRDLKPDNIIINNNKTAFLLDFNKMIKTPKTKEEITFSIASDYSAPEILNGYYYTNKVDIFSLGMIIENIFSNEINKLKLNNIINKCLNDDPDARPTISELKDLFYVEYFSKITPVPVDNSLKIKNEEQYFTYWFLISEYSNPEAQYQLGLIYENGVYLPKDINKSFQFYDQSVKSCHLKSLVKLGHFYFYIKKDHNDMIKGFNYLLKAADLNDPDAQYHVGFIYMNGIPPIQRDEKKGWKYLSNAVKQNQLNAIYFTGLLYYLLSPNYLDNAIYYFELAANQNLAISQHALGSIYSDVSYSKLDIKKALHYFSLASDQGYPPSQYSIGMIYFNGSYVVRNIEKAIYYFKLSADSNFSLAQYLLFRIYYEDKHAVKNIDLSIHYLEKAANNDLAEAQYIIGQYYLLGINVNTDLNKGVYYLTLAANQNYLDAQKYLGLIYLRGDYDQYSDKNKGFDLLIKAANQNDVESQSILGIKYFYGEYTKKDINKAINYFTLAANNNDENAQYYLGVIFSEGKYVEVDMKKAIYYLTLSANQNNKYAMSKLGRILYEGIGVERNIEKGIYYLYCAAKFNDPVAQYNLACIYLKSELIPRDVNKAIYYFSLSADQNYASSQRALGLIYSEGIYIQPDESKALHYLNLAANQNDAIANSQLGYIYYEGKLVSYDINKAIYHFTLAANNYNPNAQFFLGFIYSNIKKDEQKSIYYFTMAANQSHKEAQKCLGIRYLLGDNKNIKKAIYYLTSSAEQHCVDSNFYLGVTYLEGVYVPRDYKKSIYFFKNASSFNDEFSKNNLAIIYNNVMNNVSFAIELLKEAISQKNDQLSMYNLAHIYYYNEQLNVNIDEIIDLLVKSLSTSFEPSLLLLSMALIKKFPHHDIDEIKSELIRYGIKSFEIIYSILIVINDYNLNVEICYNNFFEIIKSEVYVYNYAYNEVSFAEFTSFDFEKSQKATGKVIMKDINENFYEGFN